MEKLMYDIVNNISANKEVIIFFIASMLGLNFLVNKNSVGITNVFKKNKPPSPTPKSK